jgi:hypothetical protein
MSVARGGQANNLPASQGGLTAGLSTTISRKL